VPGDEVTIDRQGHVALVGFHRPPNNFFDTPLVTALADAMDEVAADVTARAVVLWSEGKHFCAGARIGGGEGVEDVTESPLSLYEQGLRLFRCPLPLVAAVQGAAVGGGLGLALAADFRVATPATRFRCNFSRLGFHHGFGLTVTLPPVVGQQRALELLYTGGELRGQAAADAGLCDRLVSASDLVAGAVGMAAEIAESAPLAVRAIRLTMRAGVAERVWKAMQEESAAQLALAATDDFGEGVRAASERRAPVWTGR
jgi:2-(1,2-epoxy-1,2-dihydrophenyl)acetyl-CoA isomerase